MPRGPRIAFENAFYHVFNRGVAKQPIFHDDSDYCQFLKRLVELKTKLRFDHLIYAYILMPNHFHLLIRTRKIPIAKIMTSLTTSYSMFINRKYKRGGPLFQNRFKSKLVDKDSYFLGASRYIILNPIEAGLVKNLAEYQWSSYQELFGTSNFHIIDQREVIRLIGETDAEKKKYQEFLLAGIDRLQDLKETFSFDKDIEGKARFATLTQKKYLRRTAKRRKYNYFISGLSQQVFSGPSPKVYMMHTQSNHE